MQVHKDPGTPLCRAASLGNLPLVDMLLDHGALINRHAGSYGSALGSALANAHFPMAKHLLDMGADPNAASLVFGTPLSFAVKAGDTAMVRLLIERGAEVGKDGYALAEAASSGDLQMLKLLLTYEGLLGTTEAHLEAYGSALQSACGHGNLNAAKLLLDHGVDPNTGGRSLSSLSIADNYSTPLEAAAFNGNLPVVRLLIESGADINKSGLNYTALSRAVDEKDEQMVTYLLQNGARDASCLRVAVEHRCSAITKQLLEHGMDINARDETFGQAHTALHWAAQNGDTDIVSLLLQHKADTSIRLNSHYRESQASAFDLAVEHGHIDSAFAILAVEGRSMVNLPDNNGNTAVHRAASAGQSEMVDALLALPETTQIANNEGETALHMIALSRFRGRFDSEESHGFYSATFSLPESESAQELEKPVKIPGVRIAKSLMAFYERVDIQDKHGVTPLMRLAGSRLGKESERWGSGRGWKVSRDDERIIDCMIQHGARFDQRDPSGKTLLHYAAILGCESRVRWLSEHDDWRNLNYEDNDGRSPLSWACGTGNEAILRLLLGQQVDCNKADNDDWRNLYCEDNDGRTPLSWACRTGNEAVLRLLLGQKVDCNKADKDDWTPLEQAAAQRDESTMKLLLAAGAQCRKQLLLRIFTQPLDPSSDGLRRFKEYRCLKTALSHGADPSVKNEYGESLLHCLAYRDNLIATEPLLGNQYLDINTRDCRGRLALHVAAKSAGPKLVEYLLDNGSRATAIDLSGCTALHRAADENYEILIKRGASLHAKNNSGRTPLHYLCQRSTDFALDTVRDHISRGECSSMKDNDGIMPLDLALPWYGLNGVAVGEDAPVEMLRLLMNSVSDAEDWTATGRGSRLIWHFASGGYAKEILFVVEKGGSVHARGRNWRTPLHQAACCSSSDGSQETVAALIAHGADVDSLDNKRRTALHLAAKEGNDETTRLLLKHGSEVNYRDIKRRTALHLAALNGQKDMVTVLLEAGADPSLQDHNIQTPRDLAARRNRKGIMALLTESHVEIPDSISDPDSSTTSESSISDFGVDTDYERPHSDDSRDDDSLYSNLSSNQRNSPSICGGRHKTRSLCGFESNMEDGEENKNTRTQRRSSI